MLKTARSYEEACRTFRWRIPERYNLAFDSCDRQTMAGADGHRTALIVEDADGVAERYTFHALRLLSNRLANVLTAAGLGLGDRVVVSLPPSVEAAVAVLAVTKMGAVAVPVPTALGADPMGWRLSDSGARAAVVAAEVVPALLAGAVPPLVLSVGEAPPGTTELWEALERASDSFAPVVTAADDPALLFYPADSCGTPRGVLHGHRAMPGNLPGVEFALGFFAQFGDVLWTSAEWMSFEALMWALLPAWHHGVPVVARAGAFDPEAALALMARHGVRTAYLPPGHLEAMTQVAAGRPHPVPRALAVGPGPLAPDTWAEAERAFSLGANEIWGVCETGAVAANNHQVMERRPGSPGRAVPGVTVEAVDGRILEAGRSGVLAVSPNAPGGMLGYWGEEARTTLANGWLSTRRQGMRDLDGYLWPEPVLPPEGVVLVGGLAVNLDEVQAAVERHDAVAEAGVVQMPTGELKAFVGLKFGRNADAAMARGIQSWVGACRARHEAPAKVEFVDVLPRSAEGRIRREDLIARPPRLEGPCIEDRW